MSISVCCRRQQNTCQKYWNGPKYCVKAIPIVSNAALSSEMRIYASGYVFGTKQSFLPVVTGCIARKNGALLLRAHSEGGPSHVWKLASTRGYP